tara:strand:+ start:922 stop:1347 length:426 start_codon:yes stop_codon:yes gene_type:complete
MATTTARINIGSDIMSYPININKTMTMKKLASCHGIEETSGLSNKKFSATTAVVLVLNTEGTAGKASKVYMRNTGADKANFFYVSLNASAAAADTAETIGRLHGGDWMLIPWAATANASHNIVVAPNTAEPMTIEWMVFQE